MVECIAHTKTALGPQLSSPNSVLYDIIGDENVYIKAGEIGVVSTNVSYIFPAGVNAFVFSSRKSPLECVFSEIGSDFQDIFAVTLHNHSDKDVSVKQGDIVAALTVQPGWNIDFVLVK